MIAVSVNYGVYYNFGWWEYYAQGNRIGGGNLFSHADSIVWTVPNGGSYKMSGAINKSNWYEMR
jgi:hypothetical protein